MYDGDANYTGIAKTYREYLIRTDGLTRRERGSSAFSLYINGGILAKKSFLGVPYETLIPLTTLAQAETIIRELYEETGIKVEKEELILFDHVITPRIFSDTYLLRLAEEPKIALQSTETVDYAWLTPAELLERCREGMVIGHLAERFARYAVMLEDVLQKEGEK